jgi:hypothetical protein
MPDNSTLPATGDIIAADEISGVKFQRIKLVLGADGVNAGDVASGNPMPVQASALPLPTGASTEATLAAMNAKLPALSGGRLPVELPAGGGGLTNSELRATPVPVSGTFWQATQPVSFTWSGLTDAQLRAAAVPVSVTALPLPTGAASETTLAALNGKLPALSGGRVPVELPAGGGGLTDAELRADPVPMLLRALYYPASAGNNTTTQLAANATFTGAIETVQNLQSAQVQVVCDQPYTLRINQYIDAGGTKLTESTTIVRQANQPVCLNVLLPGNFFNLSITNTGITATTTLQIDTTFGIMDTLPKTLGQKVRDESMAVTLSSDDIDLLNDIRNALAPLMSARGTDGALRLNVAGGTLPTVTTVGTVTTVTGVTNVTTVATVSNVANQTAVGGLQAVNQIPALMNIAAASNIDRMVG